MRERPANVTVDILLLKKDDRGYIHMNLRRNSGNAIENHALTITPEKAGLPFVNSSVVFIQDEYLALLQSNDIIDKVFKSKGSDIWCGFVNLDVYFELDNAPDKRYTKTIAFA